jgi:hypothetical protein
MSRFHKHDVAKAQLQTAVSMFLEGRDRSSVITLAGAASGILDALVRRSGQEAFLDYARRAYRELSGQTPKRSTYSHHINTRFGVIAHKHLWEEDSDTIELDLEEQAAGAISRAVADYISLNGKEEPFVKAFLSWSWSNQDGPGMMEKFKAAPERLKPR